MIRDAYNDLLLWKSSDKRKPLLFQGARQVGKTYLVKQFGKNEYKKLFYFNFEEDSKLAELFSGSLDPNVLLTNLSLYTGQDLFRKDSLIFFDEIQIAPPVLTSLKYFYEEIPEYNIIAAGSLLGVSIGKENSFPVGKD